MADHSRAFRVDLRVQVCLALTGPQRVGQSLRTAALNCDQNLSHDAGRLRLKHSSQIAGSFSVALPHGCPKMA